jgi:copper chaperone CopZ
MNAYEAYVRSSEVEVNMVHELIKKIDKAVDRSVDKGLFEVVVDVNGYSDDVIKNAIKDLKAREFKVHYESWMVDSAVFDSAITVNWAPSSYSKFQLWLDKLNEKVGAILGSHA